MTIKALLPLLAIALAATAIAEPADAKSKRRAHAAHPQPAPTISSFGPARMIEVKPGLWISSYGCVTDDGYGRRLPCDITDGNGR